MTRDQYLKHLAEELRDSVRRSEASEARYNAAVDKEIAVGKEVGRDRWACEVRASSTAVVRSAVADGAFYRSRVQTYSLAILAEEALERRGL